MASFNPVFQCLCMAQRPTQGIRMLNKSLLLISVGVFLLLHMSLLKAGGPLYWRIANVEEGSTINVRSGPSTDFQILGVIAADTKDIKNEGCSPMFTAFDWQNFSDEEAALALNMRWCRVSFRDLNGWVYGEFLQLQEP